MGLNIIYDSGIFWNKESSGGTHILEVLSNLGKNHEIKFFGPEKDENKIKAKNFSIYYISITNIKKLDFLFYEFFLFIKLFLMVLKDKPDIIFARNKYGISSLFISLLFNVPRIQEVNGFTKNETALIGNSFIERLFLSKIETINYRFSNKIVAVSSELKNVLVKHYSIKEKKIIVVENGANEQIFRPIDRNEAMRILNFNYNNFYIGFVGSFSEWHGLEILISAAPKITERFSNVKFILIGGGRLKKKIVKTVEQMNLSNFFVFLDYINHDDLYKYMNLFDVGVILKSKHIPGSPLKLYEYMACGAPILATDSLDFEIIKKSHSGILVNPENSDEITQGLIHLLKDKELRERMGKNGRNYIIKNRTWKMVSKELEDIMYEIVKLKDI